MNPIIERDEACLICGASDTLQVHHLISRRFTEFADDPKNMATLCAACHEAVERRHPGFAVWKISTNGDMSDDRLGIFWQKYWDGLVKGTGRNGWVPTASDSAKAVNCHKTEIVQLERSVPVQRSTGDDLVDFRTTLSRIATDYVALAVLADRIKELKLYEPEYESFDDYIEDAKLERSKGYRLAQLGRYIRLTGAQDQLPMARWNKILPLIKFSVKPMADGETVANDSQIKELVEKAHVLNERDFRLICQEASHKIVHPDEPCPIPQDGLVHAPNGELIGRVSRAWLGEDVVFITLAIRRQFAKTPLEMKLV